MCFLRMLVLSEKSNWAWWGGEREKEGEGKRERGKERERGLSGFAVKKKLHRRI